MAKTTVDKQKKEKKEKKKSTDSPNTTETSINGTEKPTKTEKKRKSTSEVPDAVSQKLKKRKRETLPEGEIEVDVTAPEPPSRRSLRLMKKGKLLARATATSDTAADSDTDKAAKRSNYGIWIGNLAFTVTKADLRKFLMSNSITDEQIMRVHLPTPFGPAAGGPTHGRAKPQNKGFAYIDFDSEEALNQALGLSETLLTGRRVLIKNSKSFEGRPEKDQDAQSSKIVAISGGKPPNNRIFVGNLGFETTEEDLRQHFERCGDVKSVFVATFEDTGKCKGFAWVEFEELQSAIAAVKGYIVVPDEEQGNEDGSGSDAEAINDSDGNTKKEEKKLKAKKVWVNRIRGRVLRMEFAEDKTIRYKKRYGKDGAAAANRNGGLAPDEMKTDTRPSIGRFQDKENLGKFVKAPKAKIDARTVKPGAALARAERRTGAIVESKGRRITFDD